MGVLKTVFKFLDLKRNIIAQTADMGEMAKVVQFAGGNPFSCNQKIKLVFGETIKTYEVVNFEIYPYKHEHLGDGDELGGKSHGFTCEALIYIKEV